MPEPTHTPAGLAAFTDDDFRRTIWGAVRLVAAAVVVGVPLLAWKLGWPSAGLFAVGALISGSGLFEWLRLMSALMTRMETATPERPVQAKPLAPVLIGFFLRLGGTIVLLYGSLKLLHGSIFALAAGLIAGVFALLVQALRLVKSWTL